MVLLLLASAGCAVQGASRVAAGDAKPETNALVTLPDPDQSQVATGVPEVPLQERLGRLGPASSGAVPRQAATGSYSFHAVGIPLADALRLFASDNGLNIIIDPGIAGELTVDFEGVSLAAAMDALVKAHGYSWERSGELIRVRRLVSRTFEIDYLRLQRQSEAKTNSGEFGLTSGGESGGSSDSSEYRVSQQNPVDFWGDLQEELTQLVGTEGSFHVNRTAGIVQVNTTGGRMEQVANYLQSVRDGSLRQVSIEVKIVEVELTDRHRLGIDWSAPNLAKIGRFNAGLDLLSGGAVVAGSDAPSTSTLLVTSNSGQGNAVLNALASQGDLNLVSQPRITVLNNQTAQIRVATETPYFVQTAAELPGSLNVPGTPAQFEQRSASIGLVLQVTPQIARDGWVSLEIVPVITRATSRVAPPDPNFSADAGPLVIDVRQTTVMARIKTGQTVVLGGLIQNEDNESVGKVPLLGDLPGVGGLFRNTDRRKARKELVVFVTPVAQYTGVAQQQDTW